jgi:putative transposase
LKSGQWEGQRWDGTMLGPRANRAVLHGQSRARRPSRPPERPANPDHGINMARLPRIVVPGVPLHLVQRGNNRSTIFFGPDDYRYYGHVLYDASRRYGCAIHAYVLMSNHVHLLVTPQDEQGPSRMMQTVGRRFVRTINDRRGRSGTLWEGRYKSMIVNSDRYFLTCSRYIELNPVRAGMVEKPDYYRWSSYRHNALSGVDPLITEHALYHALGTTVPDCRPSYRALFDSVLDPQMIDAIRYATHRGAGVGDLSPLGPSERARLARARLSPHGGDRRSEAFRLARHGFQVL